MHKKLRMGILVGLSILLLLTGCANNKSSSNVVAVVNGKEITRPELDKRVNFAKEGMKQQGFDLESNEGKAMAGQIESSELDKLIDDTLVMQEAEKQKLTLSKEEVDKKFKEIKDSYGKEEDFKKALDQYKLSEQDLKDLVAVESARKNLYDKVTADVAKPTDDEISKYYNEHKDKFGTPERLEVKHILFAVDSKMPGVPKRSDQEALQAAKLALAEITQKGRDFAVVAKERSDDAGTKENGGAYTIDKGAGTTDPAFEKAAAALKPGEVTPEPVKSQFGYHIIKLDKIDPATQKGLSEVKDDIAASLDSEKKQAKFSQFMDDLKKKAKIDNRLAPKTGDSSKK